MFGTIRYRLSPMMYSHMRRESRQRLRRMSRSNVVTPVIPMDFPMNRERINALSTPREFLILNVENGAEFCNFTKTAMSHKRLRNMDKNHFMSTYNFSIDDYSKLDNRQSGHILS